MSVTDGVPADGGQGAGASPPPPPVAGASPPPPAAPPPPPEPWFKTSLTKPEHRGYAENKGWKDPDAAIESYINLEKLRGVPAERLLTLPENLEDAEAMKPIREKFGWVPPETPDKYGLTNIEGVNADRAKVIEGVAHKHGVPAKMAEAVFKDIIEAERAEIARIEAAENEAAAADIGVFKAKYGADRAEAKIESARRFVRAMGMDEETLTNIEGFMGASKFWEFFATAGERLGEGAFVESGNKKPSFTMTPDAARAEIAKLREDRDFGSKLLAGDVASRERWERLNKLAAADREGAAA